jgi:hypothetical protein
MQKLKQRISSTKHKSCRIWLDANCIASPNRCPPDNPASIKTAKAESTTCGLAPRYQDCAVNTCEANTPTTSSENWSGNKLLRAAGRFIFVSRAFDVSGFITKFKKFQAVS